MHFIHLLLPILLLSSAQIVHAIPVSVPPSTKNWWCNPSTEYGFVGFSYEITACQSPSELQRDFHNIKQKFKGRYVRLYGFCDRPEFYNTVVEAAWEAGVGVHALIWFGFNGDDKWVARRDALFQILHSNPKAKFVTRVVQFGSEPLFDRAIEPNDLVFQVRNAKTSLASLQIPVTVSDMAYSYQKVDTDRGSQSVLDNIDVINAHMLPFFSAEASTSANSWPLVLNDLNWFVSHGGGKKIYLSEVKRLAIYNIPGVQPNSPQAVANVANEKAYYDLLDSKCSYFKTVRGGEPGYGIYDTRGVLKFAFSPRIHVRQTAG
ncbi:glycoside hydrolase family 17 protein [Infundibulicybe gibba]|nr:glycoside hydrolase family 17 protein [Infundibulicybe gibba]